LGSAAKNAGSILKASDCRTIPKYNMIANLGIFKKGGEKKNTFEGGVLRPIPRNGEVIGEGSYLKVLWLFFLFTVLP
jgi:hypothetical protein